MTSDYNVILNFNNATPVNTGYVFKAGDKGITFKMEVRELDPSGMTPKIAFHRANGTSVESASVTNSGNVYSYTMLGNELEVAGVVVADLKFYSGSTQRVSSASFVFTAIADTLDGLGGGTAGYSDELEQLSETMEGYIEAFGNLTPINPKGAYNAGTAYKPADCVSYNGISWICIQDCTGVTPAEGAYWQKMADPDQRVDSIEEEISAIENVYGSKNLLAYPYSETTKTENGITFTDNSDGTVTVSGTASAQTTFNIAVNANIKSGNYRLSGAPSGASSSTYYIQGYVYENNEWTRTIYQRSDEETVFSLSDSETLKIIRIFVQSGVAITTPITFKPMIRDARIADNTFAPYAMTNRELTSIFKMDVHSGTTNSDGLIAMYNNRKVVYAKATLPNSTTIGHVTTLIDYYSASNITCFKILNTQTMAAITSQEVTINYLYLDI